jgi:dihydroorotate dehydrogenase electron transfer subunit
MLLCWHGRKSPGNEFMAKYQEDVQVVYQQEVTERTFRLRLRSERIALSARPGQFVMLQIRPGTDPLLKRPFSFHRIIPDEGMIEILYRVVGRGTWYLSQCAPLTRLNAAGPLGNSFAMPAEHSQRVALIAGGIGIAPLNELMVQLTSNRPKNLSYEIQLFYGARTAAEFVPIIQYESLGIAVHCSTDDGSLGYKGFVTQLFESVAAQKNPPPDMVYSCGPILMQHNVAKWALAHNVSSQLSLESLMACGIGACLGCALPAHQPDDPMTDNYLHVCKDGPIFQAGSIAWTKIQRQPASPLIYPYN